MDKIDESFKIAAKDFFRIKHGLDIDKEEDRTKALKWLETASPNDMFYTDVPDDKAEGFDLFIGSMRKGAFADILVKW